IGQILGEDKVAGFAEQLGVSQEDAAGGLASMIPEMINQSSSGGSMMDIAGMAASVLGGQQSGGAGGLLGGIMGKLLGR
ncbi:MAG: YidB family protein, partial [bacterium]